MRKQNYVEITATTVLTEAKYVSDRGSRVREIYRKGSKYRFDNMVVQVIYKVDNF